MNETLTQLILLPFALFIFHYIMKCSEKDRFRIAGPRRKILGCQVVKHVCMLGSECTAQLQKMRDNHYLFLLYPALRSEWSMLYGDSRGEERGTWQLLIQEQQDGQNLRQWPGEEKERSKYVMTTLVRQTKEDWRDAGTTNPRPARKHCHIATS